MLMSMLRPTELRLVRQGPRSPRALGAPGVVV